MWQELQRTWSSLGLTGRAMIALGAALLVGGIILVAKVRRGSSADGGQDPDQSAGQDPAQDTDRDTSQDASRDIDRDSSEDGNRPRPNAGRPGRPGDSSFAVTWLVSGLCIAAIGYHLIIWNLPPGLTDLRVPVQRWYIVPMVCAALIGLAYSMDQPER